MREGQAMELPSSGGPTVEELCRLVATQRGRAQSYTARNHGGKGTLHFSRIAPLS
jgi:hypothetical protein